MTRRLTAAVRAIALIVATATAGAADLTPHLERLSTPYATLFAEGEAIYARNPWDLLAFDGRLYIGAGNSANRGPAANAGPLPIFSFDPGGRLFHRETMVDDEQLDRFVALDGTLYLPGHDARESWEWGNLYRRETNGEWRKLRTIPRAIHVYDLALHQGRLYAALGATGVLPELPPSRNHGSAVAISEDRGESWRTLNLGGVRIHKLLRVNGRLYAVDRIAGHRMWARLESRGRATRYAPVYELESEPAGEARFRPRRDLNHAALFPDTPHTPHASRISRAVEHAGRTLYLGARAHNDHQILSVGAYIADSLALGAVRTRRIPLPDRAWPADLLSRDGWAWLLLNRKDGQGGYRVSVIVSRDLEEWRELLHFTAPTFARAFERLDGDLYFGLGSEIHSVRRWRQEELHPATGELLRIDASRFTLPAR